MAIGLGMAVIDVIKVESASNEELVELAKKSGLDLNDYEKNKVRRKY